MAFKNPEEEILEQNLEVKDPGPDAILGPGFTLGSASDRITGVVYLPWKTSPKKWLVGAFISFCFVNLLMVA
ncbi:MAG: hypothetical protein JO217_04715, partial [Acidobacteriaceae bacterium]|nr:hypothetical protein [Acidobacteriaceae bacterium]